MDVSDQAKKTMPAGQTMTPGGRELLEKVAELTGLPEDLAQEELGQIIESAGHSEGTLTLDQLREAMIAYLESLQEELQEEMAAQEPVS